MGKRRKSRELAFQLVYAFELSNESKEQVFSKIMNLFDEKIEDDVLTYAECVYNWTIDNLEQIDSKISKLLKNWTIQRVSKVDLCLLRIGCAEIEYGDVPANIVINEILEISKDFGDKESTSFVNGILDSWYNNFNID